MTDRDFSRSRAVLVGTADHRYLRAVPAAANSLRRMADVLTGDRCGWPRDHVEVYEDWPQPADLPHRLVEHFADATDVALFYFVGHGQVDPRDRLCLSLVESRTESSLRWTSSLAFDAVRNALELSKAKTKIVILDCCHAGLAAQDVVSMAKGAGAYIIAAAGEYARAWYETDAGPFAQTYFTKYLTDTIDSGVVDAGPELTLEEIFRTAAAAMQRDGMPAPASGAVGQASRLVFAGNSSIGASPTYRIVGHPVLGAYLRWLAETHVYAKADIAGEPVHGPLADLPWTGIDRKSVV